MNDGDTLSPPRTRLARGSAPQAAVCAELDIGDIVGACRLVEPIACGGMGRVFRGEHVVLGRQHAVKVLHGRVMSFDPRAADRLHAEARAAARIRHPGVVEICDAGHTDDGRPFVIMELIVGPSLCDHAAMAALPIAMALDIARQAAAALAATHARGVIHADISPTNFIVARDGSVKLIDFGLARVKEGAPPAPSDTVLGTPPYMAPELFRGEPASEASDQYALGTVIYEMLTGAPPFLEGTVREMYLAHLRRPIIEPWSPYGEVPAALAEVIARCLAKRPVDRFADMHDVVAALTAVEPPRGVGW